MVDELPISISCKKQVHPEEFPLIASLSCHSFSCCSCAWNILILIIVIAVIAAIAIALGVYFGVYHTDDPELNKQITDTFDGVREKASNSLNHHRK